jgi:glycosyltransferase involved in cell wall biosynthesis
MFEKLSIVIPVFNEELTIKQILSKVIEVNLLNDLIKEIIIVDDCSTDRSLDVINKFVHDNNTSSIILLSKHETNKGKGAAIHTGIRDATGDILVIQDADLEYDPSEYNLLLKPIILGHADVVYGSRFIGGNPHRILFFWHSIGNKILTFISNMFTNLNLTDMETCYKMFKMDIIKGIKLKEQRFGFEPEVTAKISKLKNVRIYEVGISYYGRKFNEGKKIGLKDAFRALFCIFKYNIK